MGTGFAPGFEVLDVAALPEKTGGSLTESAVQSYFARANYSYDNKYVAEVSVRRDGASNFGDNARYGNFYSISGGWNIHRENWFKADWVDVLKIRASYGTMGNRPGELYPQYALYSIAANYNGIPATLISQVGNPDLTWEVLKSTNVALSTRLFDRVSLDVEYYQRKTEDMLMEIPYSYTTGFSTGWGNVASIVNRGVDITANVDILKNVNGLDWSISANVNYNKNEITELFNGLDEYVLANTGLKLQKGMPYGEYYYVRWAGVDSRDGYNMWYDKMVT